jgi:glycosidase
MKTRRNHPHLYEINTWAWLENLSLRYERHMTLADVPEGEWDRLAMLGFDVIWLMGVWERSPESEREFCDDAAAFAGFQRALPGASMEDVVGSPYSIRRYEPDERIGDWAALDGVRAKLRDRGMRLLLDFVPNHVALDHPWILQHPEYFIQGSQGDLSRDPRGFYRVLSDDGPRVIARARDPYFPPWRDVAQLNHFHPAVRPALLQVVKEIGRHCDGFRCDMAMLVLNDIFAKTWGPRLADAKIPAREFWPDVRTALPDAILLAEAYWGTEGRLLELGFDFMYDKSMYDALRAADHAKVHELLGEDVHFQNHLARFLENHDEARSAAAFDPGLLRAAAVVTGTLPGLRFYQQGQIEGRKIQLPIALSHAASEPDDGALEAFYGVLLRVANEDAFHAGTWRRLNADDIGDGTGANLIVYDWQTEKSWKLVVVNLASVVSQGRVRLGQRVAADKTYRLADQMNQAVYLRESNEIRSSGLYVRLDPFHAHIFDMALSG